MLKPLHIASILLLSAVAGAATIVTVRGSAKVYPNPIRRVFEQPLFVLDKGEVVEVLEWQKPLTKIRNRKGRVGFVDIALLDSLKRPPILSLVIDSSESASKPKEAVKKPVAAKPVVAGDSAKVEPQKPARDSLKPAALITVKTVLDTSKKVVEAPAKPVVDSLKKVAPVVVPVQKPVDFHKDSTHIQPRSNADTTKH